MSRRAWERKRPQREKSWRSDRAYRQIPLWNVFWQCVFSERRASFLLYFLSLFRLHSLLQRIGQADLGIVQVRIGKYDSLRHFRYRGRNILRIGHACRITHGRTASHRKPTFGFVFICGLGGALTAIFPRRADQYLVFRSAELKDFGHASKCFIDPI